MDAATTAFLDAGNRSRKNLARISSSLRISSSETRAPTLRNASHDAMLALKRDGDLPESSDPSFNGTPLDGKEKASANDCTDGKPPSVTPRRHKERSSRPKTAPSGSRRGGLKQPLGGIDHRVSFSNKARPRTPGSIVFSTNKQGADNFFEMKRGL